ncbi:MAG: hypothetical protein Q8O03_00025 [Nanoarchaeota archaeon]|nr:hypothetical protein [Nanoarchaeota archaeon]
MKVPQLFIPNRDLTDVLNKYLDINGPLERSTNRTPKENQKLYGQIIKNMIKEFGYSKTCAEKTIEYFCTQRE